MTDTHPTSPRGVPPARSWGRRLAAFSAALALTFGGLASAAENPWQSRGEAKTPDAQLLGSPITMTLVDNNGGDLELGDQVTVTAIIPGSLGGGDFDLWACPDQTLLPRDNGDEGSCVGPNIQDQTGDSTTFTLDSQYENFCNWYVVVHDYPVGGHSNWVGPLLGVNNCENSLPGTPQPPNAPGVAAATAQVTVNWTAPDDGGSPITGYTVEQSTNGGSSWDPSVGACAAATTEASTAISCVASPLTGGTGYVFRVRAINAVGAGAFSPASVTATPPAISPPGAPTAAIASAGNQSAQVSWTAPINDGGAEITSYTVTGSPSGSCTATAPATTCTVNGLSNDLGYTFTVVATNSAGSGAASSPTAEVFPQRTASTTAITGTTASLNSGTRARTNESFTVNFTVSSADATGVSEGGTVTVEAQTALGAVVGSCSGAAVAGSGSCALSGLKPSDNVARLVASLAQTPRLLASQSGPFAFDVTRSNTTSTLSSNSPSVFGQDIVLSASFNATAPGANPVTGTARFVRQPGNITITEVAITPGIGGAPSTASTTITTDPAVAGSPYTYNVAILDNTDFIGSNNNTVHTVNRASTTVAINSITPAAGPDIEVNETVTVSATVAAVAPGEGTPTGTVQVRGTGGDAASTTGCDISLSGGTGSCDLSFSTKGGATLVFSYVQSANFAASSNSQAVTVLGLPVTMTLTPPSAAPFFGNSYDVGYSLSGGAGNFDGAVTLLADGVTAASCVSTSAPLNNVGVCTFAAGQNFGTYNLEGEYAGDTQDLPASDTASLEILPATTEITITTTPSSSAAGELVTFDVGLTVTNGARTLLGTISVTGPGLIDGDGAPVAGCSFTLNEAASPYTNSCSRAFTLFGDNQQVTATFTPDVMASGNLTGSTANTLHDVTSAATTTTINGFTPTAPEVGDAVIVNFTVDGGEGTFEGAINVAVGGAPVVCDPLVFNTTTGVGSCRVEALFQTADDYSFVVAFDGTELGNDADSTSDASVVTVDPRSTTLSLSAAPASQQQAGQNVVFTVSAAAITDLNLDGFNAGNVASGTAYVCLSSSPVCDSGSALCTATLSGAGTDGAAAGTCPSSFASVGNYSFVANYVGNANFAGSSSAPLPYAVQPRDTSIAITRVSSFTSGASPAASALVGEQVTVSFDVDGGLGEYEGSVTVSADGPGALAATCSGGSFDIETGVGSCTFSVGGLNGLEQVGTWSFSADFIPAVEGNDAASTTGLNAGSINILQASTTLVLSSSPAPSVFGQPFTLTATVTATPPSEGYPTGDVNFFDGESNAIGVVTLAPTATPGVSTASIANLTRDVALPNGWRFVAATITNPNFAGANDFGYDHLVNRDNQTVEVSAPTSLPFAVGGNFNVSALATANFTELPSGQAVSLSAGPAGVCSGSGSSSGGSNVSISIIGGGTCVITASVPQSNNYNAVAPQTVDVEITPIDQTISFDPLPNRPAAAGTFELAATAPAGTVSFASTTTDICTVSGTTVSYVAAGTCSITASQAGNASYNAAPDVVQAFAYVAVTVGPEALDDGTRNAPYSAQFTASGTGAALPFTFTVGAGLPPGLNLAANGALTGTPTSAGSYTFTVTAADSSAAPNVGTPYSGSREYTLVIAKNPQVITFGAAPSLVFDGGAQTGTATGGGSNLPLVFSSLTAGTCSVSNLDATTYQVTPVAAGLCIVAANQPGNDDYEPAEQAELEIEVAKAEQDVLVAAATPDEVAYLQTSALSVTGGSTGGDVTYAVTAGGAFCSITGSTLTAIAADGSCTVTATMAGNDNFEPVSDTVEVTTIKAEQVGFTVAAVPTTIAYNATSALSTSGGSGTGEVSYSVDDLTVTAGITVCSLSGSTVTATGIGTCEVTATKAADANYNVATSTVVITAIKADQTITFGANPGPLTIGGATGNVVANASSSLTVEYGVAAGSETVCDVNPSNGGITMFTAGTCVLTADQGGNDFYNAAPQVTQDVVINKAQPSISLVGSGSPSSPGDSLTFTATVSGGFSPTGSVTFQNNGVDIVGCVNVALTGLTAQCVTTALPQGSNPVTASYNGDINNLTATSNTVTQVVLTGTTITLSPGNITEARFGQTVNVGYTVSGGVAPNEGNVTVTATRPGSTVTCTAPASAGTCALTGLVTTGPVLLDGYTVSAAYAGDANDGASTTAASQTLNVLRSNTNTALTIAPATSSPFGQGFTLTATVTAVAPGGGIPPGTIVFLRDGESIGEVSLVGGVATFNVAAGLPVGNYVFRAEYAQTTNYLQSFENRNYAVTAKATTTTITSSTVNPSELGAAVGFNYTVTTSPADTTPTGTVTLTSSTGETCANTVAAGSCSITFETAGARTVTAAYAGDPQHAGSTSVAFAHSVNQAEQAALVVSATPQTIAYLGTSTLSTMGGSGTGAVSYAVTGGTGSCAIVDSTLTGNGVGTCEVTATKAGDANYLPQTGTVTVTVEQAEQAALVVSATPNPVIAGQTSALSTTGGSGTGAVTYAVTAGGANCSVTGSTLTALAAGTCTVTATKAADANYLVQTGSVVVTVNPATVDLSIVKTGRYTLTGITWELLVSNAGPGAANGASVIDALPTQVQNASWTCATNSGGGTCVTASGTGDVDVDVNLPANSSVVITITANVIGTPAAISNTASVIAPDGITDTNPANNTFTLNLTVALFADGFEGNGLQVNAALKSSGGVVEIDGAALETVVDSYKSVNAARYVLGEQQLQLQVREVNGLLQVRLLQSDAKQGLSSTRWIEVWPGDAVRIDYASANGELQTRLAVGAK